MLWRKSEKKLRTCIFMIKDVSCLLKKVHSKKVRKCSPSQRDSQWNNEKKKMLDSGVLFICRFGTHRFEPMHVLNPCLGGPHGPPDLNVRPFQSHLEVLCGLHYGSQYPWVQYPRGLCAQELIPHEYQGRELPHKNNYHASMMRAVAHPLLNIRELPL